MTSQYVILKTNSYIIRMNREDNLCWFHGKVSRERAEQILKEEGPGDGVFLVRESNTAYGDYVLSVLHQGEVVHYQIRRHGEDAFFSIDDQTKIHGLDSLIEYYQGASNGLVTRLSAIVKHDPPPNDSRSHGRTNLLHRATKEGNLIVVSELLKCGYRNINAKNQDGQTAMHLASKLGNEPILKKLIESGANVNSRDTEGNTALHYACRNGHLGSVRILIEAKGGIQARNNETGCVPIHEAAAGGNLDVVKELISQNAPFMARSNSGELPIDFAREKNHVEVVEFLEKYKPPPATTALSQWYHGTLDRNEAITMLREHAHYLMVRSGENENSPAMNGQTTSQYLSGIFLVRYSDRNGGSYVLTLLHDNTPKHFMIQKSSCFLYIDEGPYMISLEHLVQHFQTFSDGLPVNLRYAVPPKPKPPVPLFSTIPKSKRLHKSQSTTSPEVTLIDPNDNNLTVKTASMINQQGVWDKSPSPPTTLNPKSSSSKQNSSKHDPLNFRSLKLKPKRNLLKSLKKESIFGKDSISNTSKRLSTRTEFLEAQKLMQNISFSTEFLAISNPNSPSEEFYNIPKNNCALGSNNNDDDDDTRSYYVESDSFLRGTAEVTTPQEENMYFIDAPTENNNNSNSNINSKIIINNNNLQKTPAGYIVAKNIPVYLDNSPSPTTTILQNPLSSMDKSKPDRTMSIVSDSEFNPLMEQQLNKSISPSLSSSSSSPNYFIPKDNLVFESNLGVGEFGSVYHGLLIDPYNPNESTNKIPVAIKTLHDERCKENRVSFLREASVMIQLRHHCIVQMIGISKGPPLSMVQELVPLGSILDYVQTKSDKIRPNFELKIWASQIACGMNFLESQHFVHRDLAARNILLASKHQAKISDFGLSRALGAGNDYYQASQGGKWPIKWYAPESFNFGTFSHASDVWSFGVTLWEMFSLGKPPYGDMKGIEVIKIIEAGDRLTKPALCPDNVYTIMEGCWDYNPKQRPTFKKLTEFFCNDPDYQNLSELVQTETIS